ncbi:MAG: flavin reductase family protein [Candidatus Omnitrophica bacterium]|nr:flavin reductase family protein [Candidatus Omnitrophota bacterium]
MKIEVPLDKANRLINSGQVILVTSAYEKKANIITLAWNMPISHKPPLMAISLAKKRFSYDLIKKSGEFAVNIPTAELFDEMYYCGRNSGRDVDKFKETDLTAQKANKLKYTPLIKECAGHLECRLYFEKEAGDHVLILGEIIHASAEKDLFDVKWKVEKARLIYHLGDNVFTTSDKEIIA